MNTSLPREERLGAFNQRASWYRIRTSYLEQISNMIQRYGDLGVVEYRPGYRTMPTFRQTCMWNRNPMPLEMSGQEVAQVSVENTVLQRTSMAEEAEQIPLHARPVCGTRRPSRQTAVNKADYAVAVIGGGPAGAVAARLGAGGH